MEVVPAQVDLEDLDPVVLEVDMVLLLLQLADRFQDKNASQSQDNSATMFPDNSARMCQRKPVQPAQDRSRDRTARVFPAASVPLSQNSSARVFQDRCANRLPRSNVTTFQETSAAMFHPNSAEMSQDKSRDKSARPLTTNSASLCQDRNARTS